jgi:hypothetical protein
MLIQSPCRKLWLVKQDAFLFFSVRLSVIGVEKRKLCVVPFKTEQGVAYYIGGILEFEN